MEKHFNKVLVTNLKDDKRSEEIIKALNCKTRRNILRLLNGGSMGIWDIAEKLNVPLSTISEHISVLIKSGIVSVVKKTSDRGNCKIVSRQYEKIEIDIVPQDSYRATNQCLTVDIPIGSYTSFNINKYCGMLGKDGYIGNRDDSDTFYSPLRIYSSLIWFDYGYLEYKVPCKILNKKNIKSISITLELCSEAPGYNENWRSDIYFDINGKRVCTYTSPGDFGARPGIYTPKWWSDGTQYGTIKRIDVRHNGCYIDGELVSNITVKELNLSESPLITLRIGVDEDAKNRGGINLFGKDFGDNDKDILLTVSYC